MSGEIASDMVTGLACSECGIYFKEPHGYPVACKTCYDGFDEAEKDGAKALGIQRATGEEL